MEWTKEAWAEVCDRYSAMWSHGRILMHGIPAANFGVHHLLPWWWLDGTHWHRWDGAICADPDNLHRGGTMTGLGPNHETVFTTDRGVKGDPLSYLLRVERAHPLPRPALMPGQAWVVPGGPVKLLAEVREGADLSRALDVAGSMAEAVMHGALLSGPTPRGRDLPWADLDTLPLGG